MKSKQKKEEAEKENSDVTDAQQSADTEAYLKLKTEERAYRVVWNSQYELALYDDYNTRFALIVRIRKDGSHERMFVPIGDIAYVQILPLRVVQV